mgnify:CR=1 FL=1
MPSQAKTTTRQAAKAPTTRKSAPLGAATSATAKATGTKPYVTTARKPNQASAKSTSINSNQNKTTKLPPKATSKASTKSNPSDNSLTQILNSPIAPQRAYLKSSIDQWTRDNESGTDNASYSYHLDASGRPLLVEKRLSTTNSQTQDQSHNNSLQYYRFFHADNALTVAYLSKSEAAGTPGDLRLDSIYCIKLDQKSGAIQNESSFFGETQNIGWGSCNEFLDLIGKHFFLSQGKLESQDSKAETDKTGRKLQLDGSGNMGKIHVDGIISYSKDSLDASAKGSGYLVEELNYDTAGNPKEKVRYDEKGRIVNTPKYFPTKNDLSTCLKGFSGGRKAILQWAVNDILTGNSANEASRLIDSTWPLGGVIKSIFPALRRTKDSSNMTASNHRFYKSSFQGTTDPITGNYTKISNVERSNYFNPERGKLTAYEIKSNISNNYSLGTSDLSMLDTGLADSIMGSASDLLSQAKQQALTTKPTSWINGNQFLFTSLI